MSATAWQDPGLQVAPTHHQRSPEHQDGARNDDSHATATTM
jgi:hypothetical protein